MAPFLCQSGSAAAVTWQNRNPNGLLLENDLRDTQSRLANTTLEPAMNDGMQKASPSCVTVICVGAVASKGAPTGVSMP